MIRTLVALLLLATLSAGDANAQWFGKRFRQNPARRVAPAPPRNVPNRYRTPYPTTTGPMSIGVFSYPDGNYPRPGTFDPYRFDNYVYDPYRFGSFEAPDLLNDPYFRERHRYDSHFPGRRQTKPLVIRP